jgi:putative ABC transport system permease protein
MTVILIAGGLMAGMNTMFTSILGRSREMGVLLVLGYKRRAVLLSFILESILLCLVGGAIGVGAGTSLSGLPMKISMGAFRFKVDAQIIVLGLALAVVIGLLGALLPVLRVSRLRIVDALRAS